MGADFILDFPKSKMGDIALDPLRATGGTRPGRELLPWHQSRRPRNRASPLCFRAWFGRAPHPARDPMALQSLPQDAPVPPGRGPRPRWAGERPRGAGGPRALPPRTGGEAAGEGAPRAAPAGHTGALPARRARRTAAASAPAPAGRTASFPGSAETAPAASSAPRFPQLRPDGDPAPATPVVAAAPAASPCRLGLRAARSAWKLSSSGTSILQPAQPGPRITPALTLTLGRRCGARRDSVGSRSAGGRGGWRSWGRSGRTEARGRRVPRPRG